MIKIEIEFDMDGMGRFEESETLYETCMEIQQKLSNRRTRTEFTGPVVYFDEELERDVKVGEWKATVTPSEQEEKS